MVRSDGFSHKALGVIADSLQLHIEILREKGKTALDGDLLHDLQYLEIVLAEVREKERNLVARLGTGPD